MPRFRPEDEIRLGIVLGYWESSGKSDEWWTPPHVFEALGCRFDLDPACPAGGGDHVPTDNRISWGGLEANWSGFIWLNPPFGGRNGIRPWLDRFAAHGNGIVLTPDRTSAPWFQEVVAEMDAVLFTPKLKFLRPDGSTGNSPSNGSCLMAIGWQGCAALERGAGHGLGVLLHPTKRRAAP